MMTELLRPEPLSTPTTVGLLRADNFQVAYVTNDLDKAVEILRDGYGITDFKYLEAPMPGDGQIRVAFAWVGGTMYEIIDAKGPSAGFYSDRLPQDGVALRFHHLGFFVHSPEALAALEEEFRARGRRVAFETRNPGFLDAIYVEAEEFGHYLEYILPYEGGVEFFNSVPVNK